jgi:hypothetical protein
MAGRSWTQLFFLDEAVALSAGHRPCFRCRREAAELFRAAWAAAKARRFPSPPPSTQSCTASASSTAGSVCIRYPRVLPFLMAQLLWRQDRRSGWANDIIAESQNAAR